MIIPEKRAKEILISYEGYNNKILEYKWKLENLKGFSLSRKQADYINKAHNYTPKIVRKYVTLTDSFSEKLMEEKLLVKLPKKIWCEKLLFETDKAYHFWGKYTDNEKLKDFWIPKTSVVPDTKKLKKQIDYSKYDHRAPFEHQKPAIESLLANKKFILADDMGLGKSLSINTLVYTPTGRKKIGDIKVGDMVIGTNGRGCKVQGVFPQGILKTYKITFNDGYSILCSGEHLWRVFSNNFGKNGKNGREDKEIVLTTEQMLDKNLELEINGKGHNKNKKYKFKTYYKAKNGNSKWQIPIVEPIHFENNETLPINPYLLGLSLGDGYILDENIRFMVHKNDFDELFLNTNINETKSNGNKRVGNIVIKESLKELKLNNTHSWDKFIPEIYKYSSIENRLALLQGLMDTDGTCNKSKNGNFSGTEYVTVSEQLADDVAEIVHSLGGIVRRSSKMPTYSYKGEKKVGRKAYKLNIKLPEGMNPFRLKRKADLYNTPKKYPTGRYIKNIEPYEEKECVCISVDSPDKLYVTEHAIVTHNTTSAVIAALESGAKKVLIICSATLKITWEREIKNYTNRRILIAEKGKWGSTFDFYIINYDILKNYHALKKDKTSLIKRENFDLIIVDEAHNLSNNKAQRTKLALDIIKDAPRVWLLTGTPMTSKPINYYNLLKMVNSPITENWQHFVKRYCGGFQFTINRGTPAEKKIWKTDGATNLNELKEVTNNKILRRLKNDKLDLPPKIVSEIPLELENLYLYDSELREFIEITKEKMAKETLTITLARLMAIRQLLANEKLAYTREIIDKYIENDKKIIVFTNFTSIVDELAEAYGKKAVVVDGRMNKNQRQRSVDEFQNNPKVKIFIGNLIAAGTGLTLTAAEAVIMNDLSFVPAHHNQAEDRAYRIGQDKTVNVYYPIFENTIELKIYEILKRKTKIINQVMGDEIKDDDSVGKELIKNILDFGSSSINIGI